MPQTEKANPINRRISIIVLNKKAEEAAQQDGGSIEVDAEKDGAEKILGTSGVSPASSPVAPGTNP
jgi:chemotaxis protein MotB